MDFIQVWLLFVSFFKILQARLSRDDKSPIKLSCFYVRVKYDT